MKHLENFVDGIVGVLLLHPRDVRSYVVENNGFLADSENLRSDQRRVAADLAKGVKKAYVQQGVTSKGY